MCPISLVSVPKQNITNDLAMIDSAFEIMIRTPMIVLCLMNLFGTLIVSIHEGSTIEVVWVNFAG